MLKSLWRQTAVRHSLIIFLALRLFLTGWAVVAQMVVPLPETADERIRPYLNQPILDDGATGLLLGPWQRFDALHYTRIAAEGYAHPEDSVFPPIYPLLIRALGGLFGGSHTTHMAAGIFISNVALLGLLILLHKVGSELLGPDHAPRLLLYFVLFPAGFFLFAPYSESLFLLLTLASLWLGFNDRLEWAGVLGLLAALTRLTGWVLIVPGLPVLAATSGPGGVENLSGWQLVPKIVCQGCGRFPTHDRFFAVCTVPWPAGPAGTQPHLRRILVPAHWHPRHRSTARFTRHVWPRHGPRWRVHPLVRLFRFTAAARNNRVGVFPLAASAGLGIVRRYAALFYAAA